MKQILFSLVLTAATVALAQDNAGISGKWNVHNNIAGNENDIACTLTQKEGDLTGTCTSESGPVNITGKVDKSNVNWTYKSEYNGGPITLTYKGKLDAATQKISGSVTVEEYSTDGEFTATQSK